MSSKLPNITCIQVENGIVFAEMIGALVGLLIIVGIPGAFISWLFDAYLVMGLFIGIPLFLIILCGIGIAREK